MNRSKSIVEKKNAISGGVKPAKTVKGAHDKQKKPKKMKMSSLIPCEFDNDLHEDLRKEEEFRQRQAEKKEREKQLAQE